MSDKIEPSLLRCVAAICCSFVALCVPALKIIPHAFKFEGAINPVFKAYFDFTHYGIAYWQQKKHSNYNKTPCWRKHGSRMNGCVETLPVILSLHMQGFQYLLG